MTDTKAKAENYDGITRYDNVAYFKHQEDTRKEVENLFLKLEKEYPEYNVIINDVHLDVMGIIIHYSKIKR